MFSCAGKTVLVTGGNGFLGSWIVERLHARKPKSIIAPSHTEFDLTRETDVKRLFETIKPQVVIHAAAVVGGVRMMAENAGTIFYKNSMMNLLLMEYARQATVERYVAIGSGTVYPEHAPLPYAEKEIWDGPVEKIAACYGFPKKIQLIQGETYKTQYGFESMMCVLGNLYGPRDHFDAERSTVIPSMINKFVRAKREGLPEVTCWGDGSATRDCIYIEDAADGVLFVMEHLPPGEWLNVSSGSEIPVKEIAETIKTIVGYEGKIVWDVSRGMGQKRRCYDVTKAKNLGFTAKTMFSDGFRKTIEWYMASL